ncbi:MAG: hypothetical protein IANPNBLG_01135 [Bryobacteraceae bacterium]|nr:hypothetical protein [Bryobacteraceae bacterium]
MSWWIRRSLVICLLAPRAQAGAVDFGWNELRQAIAERRLPPSVTRQFAAEISMTEQPEAYTIAPWRVSGGDLRGLMYGLLDAAEQIRKTGRLASSHVTPAVAIRGLRLRLRKQEWEQKSFHDRAFWSRFFETLARSRFNRLQLAFGPDSNWAPPYPYLFSLAHFESVEVEGVTALDRRRNLDTLRMITQAALDHSVDFTLGLWTQTPAPQVKGLAPDLLIPYLRSALLHLLAECPAIRAVYFHVEADPAGGRLIEEAGIPALEEAGRLVTLELPPRAATPRVLEAARQQGVALRAIEQLSEGVAVPPLDTLHPYPIPTLRAVSTSAWADPAFVRRVAYGAQVGGAQGFEVEGPPPDAPDADAYYECWGRLGFQPSHPDPPNLSPASAAAARAIADWAIARDQPPDLDIVQRLHADILPMERSGGREYDGLLQLTRYRARLLWAEVMDGVYQRTRHESALRVAAGQYAAAMRLAKAMNLPSEKWQQRASELGELLKQVDAEPPAKITALPWPKPLTPPAIVHKPLKAAAIAKPLPVPLTVWPVQNVTAIRLRYRMISSGGGFRTMEAPPRLPRFTIPAGDLAESGQLIYYFEVAHAGGVWRLPDIRAPLPVFVTDIRKVPVKAEAENPPEPRSPPSRKARRNAASSAVSQ